MMKAVNAKEFDMVASWSVDRLGRSLTDLLSILQGLHEKGVGLKDQERLAPSNTMRFNEDLLSPSATPSGATTPDKPYDEQQDNGTNRRVDDCADDAYPEVDAQPW